MPRDVFAVAIDRIEQHRIRRWHGCVVPQQSRGDVPVDQANAVLEGADPVETDRVGRGAQPRAHELQCTLAILRGARE